MGEFWEEAFNEKQEMWGEQPAKSAEIALERFKELNAQHILVPGVGYGRNAAVFLDEGMKVTGIEISQTAIDIATKKFNNKLHIHHGSVTEMPFDNKLYDGVFCYALIHLLDQKEREKLVQDCYRQLADNGVMIFTTISKKAHTYGQGTYIGKDRFEMFGGVKMYFFDEEAIRSEFKKFGLFKIEEVNESYPFYLIYCRKDKRSSAT